MPSAISPDEIQVNEDNDIVTWQPSPEPNGVIQHYNIRISHDNGMGGEELVRVVPEVMETRYDFSTLGLSAGVYVIQVGSLFFCILVVLGLSTDFFLLHTLPQIQAVTSVGGGEYSQRIVIKINGT